MSVSEAISGAVLAGGESRRMGQDKTLIEWRGRDFLQIALDHLNPFADELYILGPERYIRPGAMLLPDAGGGPLEGLLNALRDMSEGWLLLTCVDAPLAGAELWRALLARREEGVTAVIPRWGGRLQPATALYHKGMLPFAEQMWRAGERRLSAIAEAAGVRVWDADRTFPRPPTPFFNVNTPEDLQQLQRLGD